MDKYAITWHITEMKKRSTLTRMERLDVLISRLKADEPMILRDIAKELGISLRTISRDVELLRERGLPIEADRGRGGGVRLTSTWGVGRIALTYREAIDLLVSLAVTEQTNLSVLMANIAPIRRKLVSSFSSEDQRKIGRLRSRIRVGGSASPQMLATFIAPKKAILEKLYEAFVVMKIANISYRSEDGRPTTRAIETHYLVLNHPIWYAICWDHLRNDVRSFRIDRISSIEMTDNRFSLRPYGDFVQAMDGNEVVVP